MTQGVEMLPVEQSDRECKHKFSGWREHEDGRGGEQVCEHCGLGAMAWTISLGV